MPSASNSAGLLQAAKCSKEGAGRLNPTYNEGDRVAFNLGGAQGEGIIRGLASKSVVDLWIVEMTSGNVDKATYPYSCLTVPHTCLVLLEPSQHR